jgi:hypothetical protein
MKTIKTTILFLAFVFASATLVDAQVRVSVNIHLQPQWGPATYDYAEYYFLPELGIYYNIPQHLFIYPVGNHWKYSPKLPPAYRRYDLYNTYKIVLNSPRPFLHHKENLRKYGNYQGKQQKSIRDYKEANYRNKKDYVKHGRNESANRGHGHH